MIRTVYLPHNITFSVDTEQKSATTTFPDGKSTTAKLGEHVITDELALELGYKKTADSTFVAMCEYELLHTLIMQQLGHKFSRTLSQLAGRFAASLRERMFEASLALAFQTYRNIKVAVDPLTRYIYASELPGVLSKLESHMSSLFLNLDLATYYLRSRAIIDKFLANESNVARTLDELDSLNKLAESSGITSVVKWDIDSLNNLHKAEHEAEYDSYQHLHLDSYESSYSG